MTYERAVNKRLFIEIIFICRKKARTEHAACCTLSGTVDISLIDCLISYIMSGNALTRI